MEYDRELAGAPVAEIAPMPPLPPPNFVTFSAFTPICSPYSCRLSSHFSDPKPIRPIKPHAVRQPAWVSLQGRLIGAEEASSARTIGGGLSREQAVPWELFSPIHRILIVAVVAVAVANSKRDRKIYQLRKSVELKRIEELEDITCRKNMIITKLRKDIAVLEQKVVQLTRVKRPSFSGDTSVHSKLTSEPSSHRNRKSATSKISTFLVSQYEQHPTSHTPTPVHPKLTCEPSSHKNRKSVASKISTSLVSQSEQHPTSRTLTPLIKKSMNQKSDRASSRLKQLSTVGNIGKGRRRVHDGLKDAAPSRRWV
ncbi:hypothetical protein Ancab_000115 [Ancistrocladus abbreviatus]